MEAIIFIGIQGTGKSSFYKERFFRTHVRINLDMLKTRNRENILLQACLQAKQPFVVDNTNPTRAARARYIIPAKAAGFHVIGYYFQSKLNDALRRNAMRIESERVPDKGILATHRRLELPDYAEGFDELRYVSITDADTFIVKEWVNEV